MGRLIPNTASLSWTASPAAHKWMAALDVKDMFFMVPLQDTGEIISLDFL